MVDVYVERDCAISLRGTAYTAGAIVTPDYLVAYPAANGVLTDWHGAAIGTWRATSTWRTPRSFVSSTMHQIEAKVNGMVYTGRGAGVGMIYRGKRKAKGSARR